MRQFQKLQIKTKILNKNNLLYYKRVISSFKTEKIETRTIGRIEKTYLFSYRSTDLFHILDECWCTEHSISQMESSFRHYFPIPCSSSWNWFGNLRSYLVLEVKSKSSLMKYYNRQTATINYYFQGSERTSSKIILKKKCDYLGVKKRSREMRKMYNYHKI